MKFICLIDVGWEMADLIVIVTLGSSKDARRELSGWVDDEAGPSRVVASSPALMQLPLPGLALPLAGLEHGTGGSW